MSYAGQSDPYVLLYTCMLRRQHKNVDTEIYIYTTLIHKPKLLCNQIKNLSQYKVYKFLRIWSKEIISVLFSINFSMS